MKGEVAFFEVKHEAEVNHLYQYGVVCKIVYYFQLENETCTTKFLVPIKVASRNELSMYA